MASELPKTPPPVKQSKTIQRESVAPYTRADHTGGDQYERENNQYSKNGKPVDPFAV